ncbi:MAG: hypothetical protein Q9191_001883 [Dirinaria sp. TL-2023a]
MERPKSRRGFSYTLRGSGDTEEQENLLPDEEHMSDPANDIPVPPNPHAHLPVYTTIHRATDDPYSFEQLRSPRMNIAVLRPMVNRLYNLHDISIVQFQREQTYHAHHHTVNNTRAAFCEILANRVLRRIEEDNPGRKGLLLLANVLVAGFEPFQNAPPEVLQGVKPARDWVKRRRDDYKKKSPALEVAIISESKILLSSSACSRVVDAIYTGRLIYTPYSFLDILPDHYKHKPISLYNPGKAPLLNQYRLIVPRISNILDTGQFVVLLVLYILVMADERYTTFTTYELCFCVYALGWSLHEFATILEHGWQVYTQNLWSFLDAGFAMIYVLYLCVRMYGFVAGDMRVSRTALEILATGAPVLIPRLAFNLMSENMLFLSLRDMMANFTVLSLLAIWCFAGFLLAMVWLGDGSHRPITVSKWMLYVWFGLDGTGIQRSLDFHWFLGPVLMVMFAFLGNTLFLTILVAMLTNTFSSIVQNANAEIQFRRAVLTLEGVKSDAIFAYQPPLNVLALLILLPLKSFVSPRWFHKVNVTAVRTLNAPILLLVGWYDRKFLWKHAKPKVYEQSKSRSRLRFWDFSRFSVHGDIQAVFDSEPPTSIFEEVSDDEEAGDAHATAESPFSTHGRQNGRSSGNRKMSRKDSSASMVGLTEHLSDILGEHGGSSLKVRLEKVEASTDRIENMLRKLIDECNGNIGVGEAGGADDDANEEVIVEG